MLHGHISMFFNYSVSPYTTFITSLLKLLNYVHSFSYLHITNKHVFLMFSLSRYHVHMIKSSFPTTAGTYNLIWNRPT